ncbi:MAG: prepilin-type N-terminal cleavage/methylation domain-containing protein [Phycisphaerales bacterium]|nr:prepilin-type N-terminal cleavage/methylation domain-containing protein [Phycisphaerales bacterium]
MNRQTRLNATQSTRSHRGFTLMETLLAMVLGSMVLTGCLGVFMALRNMETTFANRYETTSELDITHSAIARSMLSLQMEETTATTVTRSDDQDAEPVDENAEPDPRARIILETDPSVAPDSTGWIPQRFEIVTATPPVPAGLASQAAGWYTAQDKDGTLDFSAMDGSQGVMRSVFEFRPHGQRERIMQQLGLIQSGDPLIGNIPEDETDLSSEPPNWTLWWRPILSYEGEQLLYGAQPFRDSFGTADEIRARLAGAVPLIHNVDRCIWELFKGDEFITSHVALEIGDLPAFAQFEMILTNEQYASWMFEIDWVLGDDPSTSTANELAEDDSQDDQDTDTGDDTGRPTRPNGQPDPNATRTLDFSDS